MKTMRILSALLCLSGAAHAQTVSPVSPGTPVVDPVARAMAQQALTLASAPVISKTTVVGGPPGTPVITDATQTLGAAPIQVMGDEAGNVGFMAFKYGADAKGVTNYWVKSRGVAPNTYGQALLGDRVVTDFWQAGNGWKTAHVGLTQVTIDSAIFNAGEMAGRWSLYTGTGYSAATATKQFPDRWGSKEAIVANSYQQIMFPGGMIDATPGPGGNFGGWVVIGAGAATPGFGPLKFLSAGAALLTTPEAGAFEVDATARPYFTAGDGVRRSFVLADTAAPTVRALGQTGAGQAGMGAGVGATARIDASGNAGVVTLTTGPGAGTGDLFTVTYAHPYPAASYPIVSAANAAAVALVRGAYLTATPAGFTLSLPAGTTAAAGTTYAITFGAAGR